MTVRINPLQHSAAIFGAVLLTAALVVFSTPVMPFA